MICKKCGSDISEKAKFCTNCGSPVELLTEKPQPMFIDEQPKPVNMYSPYGSADNNTASEYVPGQNPYSTDKPYMPKPKSGNSTKLFVCAMAALCVTVLAVTVLVMGVVKDMPESPTYLNDLPDTSDFSEIADYTYVSSDEAQALFEQGASAYDNCNYGNAVNYLSQASELGSPEAMNLLGDCYFYGDGVGVDDNRALELYLKAADYGFAEALYNAGYCFEYGYGTDVDEVRAFELYTKSAERGNDFGQNSLGNCYYYAFGTEQDYEKAVYWFTVALAKNNLFAQNSIGECYYTGNGVEKNLEKAFEYFMLSAKQDYAYAQYNVGYCYYYGEGVECDYVQAEYWLNLALNNGYEDAREILDLLD